MTTGRVSGSASGAPAVRRLARSRWTSTLIFTVATAVCLVILAAIAAHVDSVSLARDRDLALRRTAQQIALNVAYADGRFAYGDILDEMQASADTVGRGLGTRAEPYAFVDDRGVQLTAPGGSAIPDATDRTRLLAATLRGKHSAYLSTTRAVTTGGPTNSGGSESYRWVAVPVDGSSRAVVIVGTVLRTPTSHRDLLLALAATVIALIVVASFVGHILSGRAMRPAVRALAEHEQFLLEASHELRTPLTAVRLIIDGAIADDTISKTTLHRVAARLERMSVLVSTLLTRARTSSGAVDVTMIPLRLDQLVETTIEELPEDERRLVTVTTRPGVVDGDHELLAQALRNLIDNALRYGSAPVEVTSAGPVLRVRDHGPGIAPRDRQQVLQRGVGDPRGTGIGLAITRWVAELHHAELALTSPSHGDGLEVTLRFTPPIDTPSQAHGTSAQH